MLASQSSARALSSLHASTSGRPPRRPAPAPARAAAAAAAADLPARFPADDWRRKARPIPAGGTYPAKENCSSCGLCDTYFVAKVKDACAFLGDGMSRIPDMERAAHGRARDLDDPDELRLGVTERVVYARARAPVAGAQWTGVVTRIALEMLESGAVEAVVCVQAAADDRFAPRPLVARCAADIVAAAGVKPTLSPNLEVLATVEALGVKRLLFIGVGCQVQALRAIEPYLGLEELFVLGTNCTDNGPREGLDKFLAAASADPATVRHYEFMQVRTRL
jgi:7-hydroxymethyl chlorophyll a reductase